MVVVVVVVVVVVSLILLIYGKGDNKEYSIVLHHLFIDFMKACDSLRTKVLRNIVIEVNILTLVGLFETWLNET